ncbi:MAG: hypothetical protein DSY35_04205 [Desulfurobacterium sp.]|nr:MAG: hypothetical protein DSY35_04205 [Desulfurobacterium sp.]
MRRIFVVLDSWFLIAILRKESNSYAEAATDILNCIRKAKQSGKLKKLYILWPIYYETLNTKTVKDRNSLQRLRKFIREFHKELVNADDTLFREECLNRIKREEKVDLSLSGQVIGEFLLRIAEESPYEEFILIIDDEGFSRFIRYWRKENIKIVNACWKDIEIF